MKLRRLCCLLVLPAVSFFSCNDPEKTNYDYGNPVTVAISAVPEPFAPGTELLVGLNKSNSPESGRFEARGNGIVDSAGKAEISLHYPTGLAFHGDGSTSNRLYILKDYQTMEILFQTKEGFALDYTTTVIAFDFSTDFEAPPP
jgi:hypothetical protein